MPLIPYIQKKFRLGSSKFTYLWKVLKSCEAHNISLPVKDSDRQVGRFNKFKNSWVAVDSVVDVVFANLYQVNDLITVVWISSSQDDSVVIKIILFYLLVSLKFWVHS